MNPLYVLLVFCALATAVPKWEVIDDTGNRPSRRGAARMETLDDKLIIFAGFEECFDINAGCDHIWYNQVWHFDLHDETWTQASPSSNVGVQPGERGFLGSAKYHLTDSIMYFGGVKYNILFNAITFYGDLWQYFPRTDSFVRRNQRGPIGPSGHIGPGNRAGTALAIDGHTMYAVAGIDDTGGFTYRNDVWSYNLRTDEWTILFLDHSGDPLNTPPTRYLASMAFHPGLLHNELIIYGGNAEPTGSGHQNEDTWFFNLHNRSWRKINSIPGPDVGRTHGAFALWQDKWVIALGDKNDDAVECRTNEESGGQLATNGTWIMNVNGLNPVYCKAHPLHPPRLKRVAFARKANKMFVWGGFDFNCVEATAIWNTNVYSLHLPNLQC